MKQFWALSFVPDVILLYEELVESLSDELVSDLRDFIHYFDKTWIGLEHHGERRPLFKWNYGTSEIECALPRKNNTERFGIGL